MDIIKKHHFSNALGDWLSDTFESSESKAAKASALQDAELARKQTMAAMKYMKDRKVSAANPMANSQNYIIIGAVAAIMIFAIYKYS